MSELEPFNVDCEVCLNGTEGDGYCNACHRPARFYRLLAEVTPRGVLAYLGGVCPGAREFITYDDASYTWLYYALLMTSRPCTDPQRQRFWQLYDDGAADLLQGMLVSLGLVEYGTSPRTAWLNRRGEAVLVVLQALPKDFEFFDSGPESPRGCYAPCGPCPNCEALTPLLEMR